MRSSSARDRRGFVLVMVLLLISLAAIALAGTARRSFMLAGQASEAQLELQRRWGVISCRRAILGQAETHMAALRDPDVFPEPATLRGTIRLGNLEFTLLLADEDAKANLNTLGEQGPDLVRKAVQASLYSVSGYLPIRTLVPTASQPPKLASWGQVFDLSGVGEDAATALQPCTAQISCWGTGKLNLRRASDQAVRHVAGLVLGGADVGKLLALRRRPWASSDQLVDQLQLKVRDRDRLRKLVSDSSQTYSLWVHVRSPRQAWSTLLISNGQEFTW